MITLRFDDLLLRLNPKVGGSVDAFTKNDRPILRTTQQGADNALDQAAYPLIPFSGRIDQGTFTFNNRQVQLPPNMSPEPHAIHGQAWQSEWRVSSQSDSAATIALDYAGKDWPWRYRAEQTFELSKSGLTLSMSLRNQSDKPMPAGLGWHPFFPKDDAKLTADVALIWPSGDDMISLPPEHNAEVDKLNEGAVVSALTLDNAFSARTQHAEMHWAEQPRSVKLQASDELGHLVIYTPPGENFFCVEPVSHAPNCLNSKLPADVTGARTLAPNETIHAQIKLLLA